ncbi:hypothetical protein AMTR_s00116p00140330 [Amborella trichopoda]|uniref:Uncharacterized protein n=1 Tax=Amborella trichopoda TaxID=13333 RepID=W1NNY6_AMBTC|nr:hypothetical protein AMTR_s00116p00140330 [Amborella trichopoda]
MEIEHALLALQGNALGDMRATFQGMLDRSIRCVLDDNMQQGVCSAVCTQQHHVARGALSGTHTRARGERHARQCICALRHHVAKGSFGGMRLVAHTRHHVSRDVLDGTHTIALEKMHARQQPVEVRGTQ